MKLSSVLIIMVVNIFGIVPAFAAMECKVLFDDQEVSQKVMMNSFNTERTMRDYREVFRDTIMPVLSSLGGPEKVWVDMGAGAALAQLGFLNYRLKTTSLENAPHIRAVAYKYPGTTEKLRALEAKYAGVFQYIEGKQSPETIREMEPADLITDVVGIASYFEMPKDHVYIDKNTGWDSTRHIENALEITKAYIDILKPGGKLLIHPYKTPKEIFPEEYLRQVDIEIIEIVDGGQSLMITKKLQPK